MERVAVIRKESSELAPAGLTGGGLQAPDFLDLGRRTSGSWPVGLTGGGLRAPEFLDSREADSGLLNFWTHEKQTPDSWISGLTVASLRVPDLQDSREADSWPAGLTGGGLLTCWTRGRRTPDLLDSREADSWPDGLTGGVIPDLLDSRDSREADSWLLTCCPVVMEAAAAVWLSLSESPFLAVLYQQTWLNSTVLSTTDR